MVWDAERQRWVRARSGWTAAEAEPPATVPDPPAPTAPQTYEPAPESAQGYEPPPPSPTPLTADEQQPISPYIAGPGSSAVPAHEPPDALRSPDRWRRTRQRRARAMLAAATAVVVLGGGFLGLHVSGEQPSWLGGSGKEKAASPSGPSSAAPVTTATPTPSDTTPPPLTSPPTDTGTPTDTPTSLDPTTPDTSGYQLLEDPAGFTLRVPDGWQRTVDKAQVYYSPDQLDHLLQIGVNPADGTSPDRAMRQIDTALSGRSHYQRISLTTSTTSTGQTSTLEYSYSNAKFGNRRAIDRNFLSPDGTTMYFLLSVGPADEWPTTLSRFTTSFAAFCQTGTCPQLS